MLEQLASRIGRALIHYAARDSNLLQHAKTEWSIVFPDDDEMQDAVKSSVLDCVAIFSLSHHSGMSAAYSIGLITKSLKFEALGPLTGRDEEWSLVSMIEGEPILQNKRDGRVFDEPSGRGRYFIDAKVFVDPDGNRYTNINSHEAVTFPFTPRTEYINVDNDGNEIRHNPDYVKTVVEKLEARAVFHRSRRNTKDALLFEEALALISSTIQ